MATVEEPQGMTVETSVSLRGPPTFGVAQRKALQVFIGQISASEGTEFAKSGMFAGACGSPVYTRDRESPACSLWLIMYSSGSPVFGARGTGALPDLLSYCVDSPELVAIAQPTADSMPARLVGGQSVRLLGVWGDIQWGPSAATVVVQGNSAVLTGHSLQGRPDGPCDLLLVSAPVVAIQQDWSCDFDRPHAKVDTGEELGRVFYSSPWGQVARLGDRPKSVSRTVTAQSPTSDRRVASYRVALDPLWCRRLEEWAIGASLDRVLDASNFAEERSVTVTLFRGTDVAHRQARRVRDLQELAAIMKAMLPGTALNHPGQPVSEGDVRWELVCHPSE